MPNQYNFRNNVLNRTESRFLASRIITVPTDSLLLEEIPASFGYDEQDNVELHFYQLSTNALITSIVTKLSDEVVKLHIVGYDDGTYKTYLQIEFTKLMVEKNITVIPGDYRVSINFFSDEIGSYDNNILAIGEISPSRTEVELFFINQSTEFDRTVNDAIAREFVLPSFTKPDAIGFMKKMLTEGVETGDSGEGINANSITSNMNIFPQTVEDTIGRLEVAGLDEQFRNALDEYLPKLFEKVREKIIIGDERVQQNELIRFVQDELERTIQELQVSLDTRIQIA